MFNQLAFLNLLVMFTFLCQSPNLVADVVVFSEVVTSAPGEIATVDFFASDSDGDAEITSVNIPIDISFGASDGDTFPSSLLEISSPFITNNFGNSSHTDFSNLGFFDFDVVVNVVQPPSITVDADPTRLFSLSFEVSSLANVGDVFNLTFVDEQTQFQVNGTNVGDATLSNIPGQIVVAVPEPQIGILWILMSIPFFQRKRTK